MVMPASVRTDFTPSTTVFRWFGDRRSLRADGLWTRCARALGLYVPAEGPLQRRSFRYCLWRRSPVRSSRLVLVGRGSHFVDRAETDRALLIDVVTQLLPFIVFMEEVERSVFVGSRIFIAAISERANREGLLPHNLFLGAEPIVQFVPVFPTPVLIELKGASADRVTDVGWEVGWCIVERSLVSYQYLAVLLG